MRGVKVSVFIINTKPHYYKSLGVGKISFE